MLEHIRGCLPFSGIPSLVEWRKGFGDQGAENQEKVRTLSNFLTSDPRPLTSRRRCTADWEGLPLMCCQL